MSQQGASPTGHEDDWWGQLYDDTTGDTGPTAAADSLDDRFASAAGAVKETDGAPADGTDRTAGAPGPGERPRPATAAARPPRAANGVPAPRTGDPRIPAAGPGRPESPPGRTGDATDTPARGGDTVDAGSAAGEPVGGPSGGADAVDVTSGGAEAADLPPGGGKPTGGPSGAGESAGAPAAPPRAPWEPPSAVPAGPVTFPPAHDAAPGGGGGDGVDAGPATGEPVGGPSQGEDAAGVPAAAGGEAALPRAPWEPPSALPAGPVTFPPGPEAAGPRSTPPGAPSRAGTPAARVPAARTPPDPRTSPPPPPPPPSFPLRTPAPAGCPSAATEQDIPEAPGGTRLDEPPSGPGDGQDAGAVPPPPSPDYVGSGPPTYDPEPTALPAADPDNLDDLIPDTVLDGARYGTSTLRAVSLRGDSARFRGERRRDALLTARFGTGDQTLVLVAMATGARAAPGAHRAAAELCRRIGRAVGRSHLQLLADVRAGRRGDLKAGLHRLTDRSLGKLRADAREQGLAPDTYAPALRCLLLPGDPDCRTRVFFGVGAGGLFRLREGTWQDLEPAADAPGTVPAGHGPDPDRTPEGDRLTADPDAAAPPAPYGEPAGTPSREPFRFRACVARPGDVLLIGTAGLAEPLRGEEALREHLARRWSGATPPGLAAFLADARVRVKGYADDRTAAAVWEA
ncbi:protein phosphatase 2C domain-containing protein [Streptomyces leeuwenhoekii]|uniref:protein phosphatase 2C domain-containing protein n=1 Tax=Streptomyces leeuwenhoekii TaxID=1437453 RepID=UPI0036FEF2E1